METSEEIAGPPRLTVGYVVSIASGLHSFVYREIRELVSAGLRIHVYPTRVAKGLYDPPPGCEVHVPTVVGILRYHVSIFFSRMPLYLRVMLEAFSYGAFVDFALAGFFATEMERQGVQVIHCHFGDHKLFIGYLSGRLTTRPVSVTIHAYELYNNPNPRFFRHVLSEVQAIVTIAEYNRHVLEQRWGLPANRVTVIPLFADLPAEAHGDASKEMVILMVARFVEKKGHDTLFRALARLPPAYEAWLVGSGPLDLAAIAARLGVRDRVRILGKLDDEALKRAYRAATIFCLPSETTKEGDREGIPVALMEAMAYGLPVVATRHAGIPELVEEILVDEGDAEGLATAISQLGMNPILRQELGRKNRDIVSHRFSRRNVYLLESLFKRLANEAS